MKIRDIVPVALGNEPADVLIKNAQIVNIFTGRVEVGNIALFRKRIAGVGDYTQGRKVIDLDGSYVVPGFIDAHLHIESSMLSPREFAHAVLPKGTTTVIADPHEIANVLGTDGLDYLIESTEGIPLNVYIALPSAVAAGIDPITAIRMATINTARHYNLRSMGAIAPGYKADMVVLDNLLNFDIKMVIKDATVVARDGRLVAPISGDYAAPPERLGNIILPEITENMLKIPAPDGNIAIIGITRGDLYTEKIVEPASTRDGLAVADPSRDIAKVAVLDRHCGKHYSVGFTHGFGIKRGALATSIGHDAHNLCVLGMNDGDMLIAIRAVANANGGIAVAENGKVRVLLGLPIAGLMSNKPLDAVVDALEQLKQEISALGTDWDILMSLHFIQLAVIPTIKITDLGLVDVIKQEFVDLTC